MKSWTAAAKLFAASRNYWVSTVRPDGRPSATAVWGVWLHGAFWFSCAADSRKAKNLAQNPKCTVTTERADECVILEGTAAPIRGREQNLPFTRAYKRKYDWAHDPAGDGFYVVRPRVAFAFVENEAEFGKTATKYEFDQRQ